MRRLVFAPAPLGGSSWTWVPKCDTILSSGKCPLLFVWRVGAPTVSTEGKGLLGRPVPPKGRAERTSAPPWIANASGCLVDRTQAPTQSPELQLIYNTAPIGLAFLSCDCRYLQINRRLTEICGISVEDHLGRSVRDCVPALADSVEGIVHSIMTTGEAVIGIEVAGQRADQ